MTPDQIKRYTYFAGLHAHQPDEDGHWCRYTDIAPLLLRIEELEASLEGARKIFASLGLFDEVKSG